jgi:hypothetical protein
VIYQNLEMLCDIPLITLQANSEMYILNMLINDAVKCQDYIVLLTDESIRSTGKITAGKNQSSRRKTCPSATLLTINPTWTDVRSNLSLCGGRMTNKF